MPIFKVLISGTFYNQLWQNRIFLKNESAKTPTQIADEVDNFWIQNVKIPLPNSVNFSSIQVVDVSNPGGSGFTKPIAKTGSQSADNELTPFACWVFKHSTALAGRKFRGRNYIPGVLKGFFTNGILNTNGINQWTAPLAALKTNFVTPGNTECFLVIHGDGPEPHDTSVTSIGIRNTMGVQRRRNIGIGV